MFRSQAPEELAACRDQEALAAVASSSCQAVARPTGIRTVAWVSERRTNAHRRQRQHELRPLITLITTNIKVANFALNHHGEIGKVCVHAKHFSHFDFHDAIPSDELPLFPLSIYPAFEAPRAPCHSSSSLTRQRLHPSATL